MTGKDFTSINLNSNPDNLVELLRFRADTEPDTRAYTYFTDGHKKQIDLTYGELDRMARAVASTLQKKGLRGERALLLYPPGLDYIVGFFGCLYADVIAVPAYPPDPNRLNRSLPRLQAIINDARATVALTTDSILYMIKMLRLGNKLTGAMDKLPLLRKFRTTMKYFSSGQSVVAESRELGDLQWISTDSIPSSLADDWNGCDTTAKSIAFLQYTSGSTGTPKGVMLTHSNLLHNSKLIYQALGYGPNYEGVFWLPIYHDMGLIGGVLQPLYGRIPSTIISPLTFLQHPLRWLELISKISPDKRVGSAAPNFAYDLCIKKATPEKIKELDLSRWEMALSGAEPVRHNTLEKFYETFKPAGFKKTSFLPAYGLAEATLFVTGTDYKGLPVYLHADKYALKRNTLLEVPQDDPNAINLVSSGHAYPDENVQIVNPDSGNTCKPGEIGEVWIKSGSVSQGYYNRPKETKDTFENYLSDNGDGPYLRSGDLGFMKNGELFITGRVKDLIIIRGTNHYPQDIELTVEHSHPELRLGCSAAFTIDEGGSEQLVIVAEVRHSKNQNFNAIIQSIRQAITENHELQCNAIVLIKARSINKTSSGKIQRRATKTDYLESRLETVAEWNLSSSAETANMLSAEAKPLPQDIAPAISTALKDEQTIALERWLVNQLSGILNLKPAEIDIRQPFISFGLDSAQAVGLAGDLEEYLGQSLPPTLIWDYPTIESLARNLASQESAIALPKVRVKRATDYEPIAVIGMAGRFPGAANLDEFWNMLINGIDGIVEVPANRWDIDQFYDPEPGKPGKMITRHGGFIENVDMFDADFFGISRREAVYIDPQQRLLLEVGWEALEHAGQPKEKVAGSRTGVFVGISSNDYIHKHTGGYAMINPYSGTGNAMSISANRLSYTFDLHGPSMAIDTACSSSLVSVHYACQSLRDGECDMALAGGVNLILSPELTITFSQARMMSADGKCKTFDASADGYGRGEGGGMIVLKRLSDAQRDKDRILAVIQGSAINQDGRSNGITAPNGISQQAVISEALDNASLAPDQIQYIEAHGTGTSLGDPIEIESLKKVMLQERAANNPLYIGSVKTNIGHLESAAGIAGLIKIILSLIHEEIPPHLNFKELNPRIKLENAPLRISTESIPWPYTEKPRYAGISGFGFGGTNAHVILTEAPRQNVGAEKNSDVISAKPGLLVLSAQNEAALRQLADDYARFITMKLPENDSAIYDLLWTSATKRSHHDHRVAVVGHNMTEFATRLGLFSEDKPDELLAHSERDNKLVPKIAYVFCGQGPQWWAMGRELMQQEPIFRATVERISFLLKEYTGWSLVDELLSNEEQSRLDQTEVAQPALFAIQVALVAVLRTWGILPDGLVGHSIGEVAAAHVSGILSLESAVKVIYHRSRLMQKATGLGRMAAVDLPENNLRALISGYEDRLSIAAQNSITSHVLSGTETAIDDVMKILGEKDVFHKKMSVNYAFHSPQMEAFREELTHSLQGIELQSMNIPVVSTVSGSVAQDGDYGAEYWSRNIREAVKFSDAVNALLKDDYTIFIEIGPHPVLRNYIQQNAQAVNKTVHIISSLRRKEAEHASMFTILGRLYTIGYPLSWAKIYPDDGVQIDLPLYPFQRERFWIEDEQPSKPDKVTPSEEYVHPLLGSPQPSALFPMNSIWSVQLKSDYVAYLTAGPLDQHPVLPDAAYLEMAIAACRQTYRHNVVVLKNIVFKHTLTVKPDETRQLHFSLTPISTKKSYFQAYSKARGNTDQSHWMMHSLGTIVDEEVAELNTRITLDELRQRLTKQDTPGNYPGFVKQNVFDTKNLLDLTREIWSGKNEILVRLQLKSSQTGDFSEYHLHPLLLDYCFKLIILAAQSSEANPAFYTLHSLNTLVLQRRPESEIWAHVKLNSLPSLHKGPECELHLFSVDGEDILNIEGLRLQPVSMHEAFADLIYEIDWHKIELNKTRNITVPDKWFIFAASDDSEKGLVQKIQQKGWELILAQIGPENKQFNPEFCQLNPSEKTEFKKIVHESITKKTAILCFMNGSDIPGNLSLLEAVTDVLSGSDLHDTPIWLISSGAVAFENTHPAADENQAFLWDIGQHFLYKYPELNMRQIDLRADSSRLIDSIRIPTIEKQIIVTENQIYGARLVHNPHSFGKLPRWHDLRLPEYTSKPLASGQVEIQVLAVGLGRRDLKIVRDPALHESEPIGIDCAGVVRAVADDVTNVAAGDEVMALAPGSLNRYVTTTAQLVVPKPEGMTFEQAAGIPLNFLTAHYALNYLARIQAGDKVLVLNASNPLGTALVQVAKTCNAEVFATISGTHYVDHLKELNVDHILRQESLAYLDAITEITKNQGVDIIVNTSVNEQLSSSFSIIREFGRFLELNTEGAFDQPLVYHNLRRNISFFAIDMEHIASDNPSLVQKLFNEVAQMFVEGRYTVPKINPIPLNQLSQSFQQIEHRRKTGKFVVSMKSQEDEPANAEQLFDSDLNYLIAGTSSINDQALIQWMYDNGARNFAVNLLSDSADETMPDFKYLVPEADIQIIQLKELGSLANLSGIIISLGKPLLQQAESLRKNIGYIFTAAETHDLDFLISISMFSLMHDVNSKNTFRFDAFLEMLSRRRRSNGLPATFMQLGGEIPNNMKAAKARWQVLSHIIPQIRDGHFIISETNWQAYINSLSQDQIPALYQQFYTDQKSKEKPQTLTGSEFDISRTDLLAEPSEKRQTTLESYLKNEIARVVRISSQKIKLDQPLTSMGIDSLMAIEMKNTIEGRLGVTLPIALLLQGPSIRDLSAHILPQLLSGDSKQNEVPVPAEYRRRTDAFECALSYGQKAMYFQHIMNPASIFNLAYAVRIRSKFDMNSLQHSFQLLAERHDSLRTTFILKANEPVQIIHPEAPVFFFHENLSTLSEAQLHERLQEETLRHFDLEHGPLLRVFIFRTAAQDHVLLFVMHHIVTDIWSQALLLNELSEIFKSQGMTESLPPVEHDYTEFVRWQQELLTGSEEPRLFAYWKKKLDGELPLLNIPTDRPRPAVQTFNGKTETVWFGDDLSSGIKDFSEREGVTVFTTLLAAYFVLLQKYTHQTDIIVGSPTAGRNKKEFANIIGYFVNPVPFRTDLSGNPSFKKVLESVRDTVLEAFDNMDYPLPLLVEKLHPQRDASRTPLFQTMFILQRAHLMHDQGLSRFALSREGATLDLGGLTIESMALEQGVAPFDLTMMTIESGSGLAASLGYNVDLFDQETITRMLGHFMNILQQIVNNPGRRLSQIELMGSPELNLICNDWNKTAESVNLECCVHHLVEDKTLIQPDKPAVVFENQRLTYRELNCKANQLAHYLIRNGVRPETMVGICVERSLEMVIALLGVLKAGGGYVPIDPNYPQERIQYMLSDSNISIILTQQNLVGRLGSHTAVAVCLDNGKDTIWTEPDSNPEVLTQPENIAYVIYTSGSTGKPKGTVLQHRGLSNTIQTLNKKYYYQQDSNVLQFASFSFDASVEEVLCTLTSGGTLHIVKRETLLSLPDLIRTLNESKINNMTMPPSLLNILPAHELPEIRRISSAGEKCTPELVARWSSVPHIINGYGPTEGTICAAAFEVPENWDGAVVPIGKPISNVRIYILDEYLNPVPLGVSGELHIGGAGLARGYLNRADLTAERFIPDPFSKQGGERLYKTGDIARWCSDGNIEFIARIDYQVKIRGFRIELGEIESALLRFDEIREAAVLARNGSGDTRLIAYIVPASDVEVDRLDIQRRLREELPDYMIPAAIVTLPALPLTSNGKLDRRALPDPDMLSTGKTFVRPGSETERKLAKIWLEVLKIEQAGIHDSFFDLGGHSLGIIQVQGKIKEQFNKDVTVVDIFKYPTISTLAKFLDEESNTEETIRKSQQRGARQREAATRMQQARMKTRR